jgi:hypothetical protein
MTTSTTYDEALAVARRLPLAEQLRLARALADAAMRGSESWPAEQGGDLIAELDDLVAEAEVLGPAARDSADLIREMRR